MARRLWLAATMAWTVVSVVAVLAGPGAARPQAPSPVQPATIPAAPPLRLDTLDQALARVRRGVGQKPVLVVDAASVLPGYQQMVTVASLTGTRTSASSGPPPPPPGGPPRLIPRPDGSLDLRDVAAFFDRKVASAGSVSVLAPATMVVLNPRPGKPDLFAGLSRAERLQMLLASLTPAEWRALGGARGLGAGDLATPAQRDLFLSLLPRPFRVRRSETFTTDRGNLDRRFDGEPIVLSAAQRAAVRLRLVRRAALYVPLDPAPDQPGRWRFRTVDTARERPDGTVSLFVDDQSSRDEARGVGGRTRTTAYGVLLRSEVPSRAKPGDLAFASPRLNAPLSLDGAAATLGDLVRRAGEAARLTLYADARVAALPVTVLGDAQMPVRSGDVLQALALAVTGTFRKIVADETAWVLTDDVEGIGTRQARLSEWASAAGAQAATQIAAWKTKIVAQNPAQYLGFAPDDPHALPASVQEKITTANKARSRYSPVGDVVNIADLPAAYQQMARAAASPGERRPGGDQEFVGGQDPGVGVGQVGIRVSTRLVLDIPGMGTADDPPIGNLPDNLDEFWREPIAPPLPPSVQAPNAPGPLDLSRLPAPFAATRALVVRPAGPEPAAALVREAHGRGFNQVWLVLPALSPADDAQQAQTLVEAALKAGKQHNVAITVVASLLRRRPASPAIPAAPDAPGDALDRNLLGETSSEEARRRAESGAGFLWMTDEKQRAELRQRLLRTGDLLRVDAADVAAERKRWVLALAATPGLAGLVLDEIAAPGYSDPGGAPTSSDPSRNEYEASGFGYTPGLRLALLRQTSVDPVDLSGDQGFGALDLPFFSTQNSRHFRPNNPPNEAANDRSPGQAWNTVRFEANRRFLAGVHAALRAAHPDLPVFVGENGPWTGDQGPRWYSLWERPDALPRFVTAGPNPPATPAQQARQVSSRTLLRIAPFGGSDNLPPWMTQDLSRSVAGWNGVVFDLRDLPAERVSALLQSAFVPAVPATGATNTK